MIYLYHGSNVKVDNPKLLEPERGLDFGIAFYLTPIKKQAEKWAKRKQKRTKDQKSKAVVSIFEWDDETDNLKVKDFGNNDSEWLDFVIRCRRDTKYIHGFDIVKGKIADDTVGETILFVISGIMRKEDALERLKYRDINFQVAFCTEDALKTLKFVKSYEVK